MPLNAGSKLSAYVLTQDSERLLARVLAPLRRVANEILIVDSGSSDRTVEIALEHGCRVLTHPFENFARQRQVAQSNCAYDHVLFVDSDEVMTDALVDAVLAAKHAGFPAKRYTFRREWLVMGRPVHALYPVVSPDYPIRILDRRTDNFLNSRGVHETPSNDLDHGRLDYPLLHFAYQTDREFERKLGFYSGLASADLFASGAPLPSPLNVAARAGAAFFKWYVVRGSWRDGWLGLRCGAFAARYTYRKYEQAREAKSGQRVPTLVTHEDTIQ